MANYDKDAREVTIELGAGAAGEIVGNYLPGNWGRFGGLFVSALPDVKKAVYGDYGFRDAVGTTGGLLSGTAAASILAGSAAVASLPITVAVLGSAALLAGVAYAGNKAATGAGAGSGA